MSEAQAMTRGSSASMPRTAAGRVLQGRVLGRLGRLEVRLAACDADVELAQGLRYRIFHETRGAQPNAVPGRALRDEDRFDRHCDHLLLLDRDEGQRAADRVVGTYRLLTQESAARAGGFYGQGEFDVADLVRRHPTRRFLELGRSCVAPAHRGRRTMELLWHGVWAYVIEREADVLFGCASLPGTCAGALDPLLGLLRRIALAPAEWRAAPVDGAGRPLPECDLGKGVSPARLPPLVKGYLRLGGRVSDHAVADPQFDTTDVLLVLPLERIAPRYVAHYGAAAERFA